MSKTLNFFEHSFNRGQRMQAAGRTREAIRHFDLLGHQAEVPSEIAAVALANLGEVLLDQGLHEAARRTTAEACRRDPNAARAQFMHAQACIQGDDADLEQAHGALLLAVELDPDVAVYRAELGKIQVALGMPEDGIQSLELAVELQPNDPAILRDLVDAHLDLGNEAKAFSLARTALFTNPRVHGFRDLWNDLRFCLAADEIAGAAEEAPRSAPVSQCRILRFEPRESSGFEVSVGRRRLRQDGAASEITPPHFPAPNAKPDRRRA